MSSGRILGDVLCEGDYTTQLFWGYDFSDPEKYNQYGFNMF